jgi:glycine/D-amino acid oxidase-like deaminating enzyme
MPSDGLPAAYDADVQAFSPPSGANESLACQLLIASGGLSGLSAAEAAMRQGLDVIVIEKGVFGKEAASGLNAGQFLTGWAKPVHAMIAELTRQEQERGLTGERALARGESFSAASGRRMPAARAAQPRIQPARLGAARRHHRGGGAIRPPPTSGRATSS